MRSWSLAAGLLALVLGVAAPAAAEHIHGIDCPLDANLPNVDGVVTAGEYADWYENVTLGMIAYFEYGADGFLRIALVGPSGGWLGVGLGPAGPAGAGLSFVAALTNGTAGASDQYFDGFSRRADPDVGGTQDVADVAATVNGTVATVELLLPLDGADTYDQSFRPGNTYTLLLAHNRTSTDLLSPDTEHTAPLSLHIVSVNEVLVPRTTTLTLELPADRIAGEDFVIRAVLLDSMGAPVARVPLSLYMRTTFGELLVGNATTDSDGAAQWFHSLQEAGDFEYRAVFLGRGGYLASETQGVLPVGGGEGSVQETPTVFLIAPVIAATLGGIWAAYGFVAFQILEIRGEGRPSRGRKTEEA